MERRQGSTQCRYWLRYPLLSTVAALGLSLVLAWQVFLPLTYALFILARRAVFPWVTWYEGFFQKVDQTFLYAVWLPLPLLVLGSTLLLRRLIGALIKPWARRPAAQVRRLLRWSAGALAALIMLPSGAVLGALLVVDLQWYGPGITPTTVAGALLYRTRCTSCHSSDNVIPLCIIRGPDRWEPIVRRMRSSRGVTLTDGQARKVVAFLKLRGSYSDAKLFEAKCLRCHDRKLLMASPRSAEEWALIIRRKARISSSAFRKDWQAQLVRHSEQALARPPAPAQQRTIGTKVLFEKKCGTCHTLDLARQHPSAAVLQRMAHKVQDLITARDLQAIAPYARALPKEQAALDRLFPHDQPVEVQW